MTLMEPWRWMMWSSNRDYIWIWPTHLMVPCIDDDDPLMTLMMCWMIWWSPYWWLVQLMHMMITWSWLWSHDAYSVIVSWLMVAWWWLWSHVCCLDEPLMMVEMEPLWLMMEPLWWWLGDTICRALVDVVTSSYLWLRIPYLSPLTLSLCSIITLPTLPLH